MKGIEPAYSGWEGVSGEAAQPLAPGQRRRESGRTGHAKVTTTLTVDAHLFEDDHAEAMDALGTMSKQHAGNVIRLRV
jgi:hypothetical protein